MIAVRTAEGVFRSYVAIRIVKTKMRKHMPCVFAACACRWNIVGRHCKASSIGTHAY